MNAMTETACFEHQAASVWATQTKYCKGEETGVADVRRRVASAVAQNESEPEVWAERFLEAQERGLTLAGRPNSAAGTDSRATWINCFVQPVGDAVSGCDEHGIPGIYVALQQATETMRRGGGVGYDFSLIRPKGAMVKGAGSEASGPVSYMHVFDASCRTVSSAGARRGAQMGILRVDHPDILELIHAKDRPGELSMFNLSIAATDAFIEAVKEGREVELVHTARPSEAVLREGAAYRRADGMWVYRELPAREIWSQIMRSTYDHGEPGVWFVDRVNAGNNLWYCEELAACNPCGEQPLPFYGCCDLGSINIAALVRDAFRPQARIALDHITELAPLGVRMLDNILDVTPWPLEQQKHEAQQKRRVGLGKMGLGSALCMLGVPYDTQEARDIAGDVAREIRDSSYRASVELAKERGSFPLFEVDRYLEGEFVRRLPDDIRDGIRRHGIRNSHLTSVAPTGTIALAFGDNVSNGCEPPFSWAYDMRVRGKTGLEDWKTFRVEDYAFRRYLADRVGRSNGNQPSEHDLAIDRYLAGEDDTADAVTKGLPRGFRAALEIPAKDHAAMVAAIQPYVDSGISKTVNVAEDYPFDDFAQLYLDAWQMGCKSLATFRPNEVTGSVLTEAKPSTEVPHGARDDLIEDVDRRMRLERLPEYTLESVRWPKRPRFEGGNPSWTYFVRHPDGPRYGIVVGHVENGRNHPFEVWVTGEPPRGLSALAKNLSHDMYSMDRGWLEMKLKALMRAGGDDPFVLPVPPEGAEVHVAGSVSAFARIVHWRCNELEAFDEIDRTPVIDSLMSPKEPKTGPDGTLSWTADIRNPATGDDLVLFLKELVLPDGSRRPYSVWLAGSYPRTLDGLCKSLSLDMRVVDPAWIGRKLRKLRSFAEPQGDFFAPDPVQRKQSRYPSTVSYIAELLTHRFAVLGLLDREGNPGDRMGIVQAPALQPGQNKNQVVKGARCSECGANAVIKEGGCKRCTACGVIGDCG